MSIELIEQEKNIGLGRSIIFGVTQTLDRYGKVIVIEDDIICGKHFLEYMNAALEKYEKEEKVFAISGFRPQVVTQKKASESFFSSIPESWGWATWKDKWAFFKKDTDFLLKTFTKKMIWDFNAQGTDYTMWNQVLANKKGKIDTWLIYWCAAVFLQKGLVLYPAKSLTKTIGCDGTGTTWGSSTPYEIDGPIDYKIEFFPDVIQMDEREWENRKRFNLQKRLGVTRQRLSRIKSFFFLPLRALRKIYRLCLQNKSGGERKKNKGNI